jgi:hypothetical protein
VGLLAKPTPHRLPAPRPLDVEEPRRVAERADRAVELLDLTLDDPRVRQSPARLPEIVPAREVVADYFDGPNQDGSTAASLQKCLDAYAVAARQA